MIEYPSDFKILCRLSLYGKHAIQAITLKDYNNLIEKFGKHISFDVLCYLKYRVYGWSKIESIEIGGETFKHKVYTNKRGLSFDAPRYAKEVNFCTINREMFNHSIDIPSLLLGAVASNRMKNYSILSKKRHKEKKKIIHVSTFIRRFNEQTDFEIFLYNDKLKFNLQSYIQDINSDMQNYLNLFYNNLFDSLKFELLMEKEFYTPLVFSNKFTLAKNGEIRVPFNHYWIFQLLYGKENIVFSELTFPKSLGKIGIHNIDLRLTKKWEKSEKAIISIKAKDAQPVIINSNFAMRFKNE